MCDSGIEEDVVHFLVGCGEFERYQLVLLGDVFRIMGTKCGWMNFGVDEVGKVALLLEKRVEGIYM